MKPLSAMSLVREYSHRKSFKYHKSTINFLRLTGVPRTHLLRREVAWFCCLTAFSKSTSSASLDASLVCCSSADLHSPPCWSLRFFWDHPMTRMETWVISCCVVTPQTKKKDVTKELAWSENMVIPNPLFEKSSSLSNGRVEVYSLPLFGQDHRMLVTSATNTIAFRRSWSWSWSKLLGGLSIHPSIRPSVRPSIHVCIHTCVFVSVCVSVRVGKQNISYACADITPLISTYVLCMCIMQCNPIQSNAMQCNECNATYVISCNVMQCNVMYCNVCDAV